MTILHRIDNFLAEIFPAFKASGNDLDVLKKEMEKYYSLGPYKPKVSFKDKFIQVEIDASSIVDQQDDYQRAIRLCTNKQYDQAIPILERLIKKNPTNSEYHRILGQTLDEQGSQEEAINTLIESLRWDPHNGWALIMMGNIFAKDKKDIETAKIYYDQAIIANPDDHISVNNIAGLLLGQEKYQDARFYAEKALKMNANYPNTHYILSILDEKDGNLHKAFNHAIEALKHNKNTDELKKHSHNRLMYLAGKLIELDEGYGIVKKYREKLEYEGEIKIETVQDNSLNTLAKMEYAENYGRDKHILKHKSKTPALPHLMMHEMVHLEMVLQAREKGEYKLIVTNKTHIDRFFKKYRDSVKRLEKKRLPVDAVNEYMTMVFHGMITHIFNVPVDLFIEQKLYDEFPELRPYQFISLYEVVKGSIESVTDKNVIEITPRDIFSKTKIYSVVLAMQFRDMYGIDIISDFKASKQELDEAEDMYGEYLGYKDDKEPGEEYELVGNWAEDLGLDEFFELIDEQSHLGKTSQIDNLLKNIENDPFEFESDDSKKKKEQDQFYKHREETGVNQAVVMYMVGALEYFKGMPKDKIQVIAREIALQGAHGYNTKKKDYVIGSIPGKLFTGFQILAYYYVSFKLVYPEMLSKLGLPYDEEFDMAMKMFEREK